MVHFIILNLWRNWVANSVTKTFTFLNWNRSSVHTVLLLFFFFRECMQQAPGVYYVNLGSCYLKKKSRAILRLTNRSKTDYFKFSWQNAQYITISPAVGHLYPQCFKEINLTFFPEESVELEQVRGMYFC